MTTPLSFNEYAAVRRRMGVGDMQHGGAALGREKTGKGAPSRDVVESASMRTRIGDVLQGQEVQVLILALTAIDISAALVQLFATSGVIPPLRWIAHALHFLEYLSVLIVLIFVVEAGLLLFAFGTTLFSHLGYTLDCFVSMVILCYRITSDVKAASLLGFVRVWRVIRLVNRSIASHEEVSQAARAALSIERERAQKALENKTLADERLAREIVSRKRLEDILKTYKDEVETLREALHIAAQSIAESSTEAPGIGVAQLYGPTKPPKFVVSKDGSYDVNG